jgi:membrane associated rhomboid family serine protease
LILPLRDHLPTRTFPLVNYALIAANVVVFYFELTGAVDKNLAFLPGRLLIDPATGVETIFTSMFMHGGWQHIAGNMLFLWIFGDNVEDAMGHARYLVFYLLGGVCAALAQGLVSPTVPMLGASGAIAAVLAAYALLYPRSPVTVLVFVFLFTFPAWLVIGLFFAVNLWAVVSYSQQGGVAFMAHVGGFIGGALTYRLFLLGRERLEDHPRWEGWRQPRRPRRADY